VNTRIILERTEEEHPNGSKSVHRFIKIAKSPMFPCFVFPFDIESAGIIIQQTEDGHVQVKQHEGGSVVGMKIATTLSQQLGYIDPKTMDQIKQNAQASRSNVNAVVDRPVMSSGISSNMVNTTSAQQPSSMTTGMSSGHVNTQYNPPRQIVRAPQSQTVSTIPSSGLSQSSGIPRNPSISQSSNVITASNTQQRYPAQPQPTQRPQQVPSQQQQVGQYQVQQSHQLPQQQATGLTKQTHHMPSQSGSSQQSTMVSRPPQPPPQRPTIPNVNPQLMQQFQRMTQQHQQSQPHPQPPHRQ
jgi:hypothetical protein